MKDSLIIELANCYVSVSVAQWDLIEKAQSSGELYHFSGRLPGIESEDGESIYVRCVANSGAPWKLTALRESESKAQAFL